MSALLQLVVVQLVITLTPWSLEMACSADAEINVLQQCSSDDELSLVEDTTVSQPLIELSSMTQMSDDADGQKETPPESFTCKYCRRDIVPGYVGFQALHEASCLETLKQDETSIFYEGHVNVIDSAMEESGEVESDREEVTLDLSPTTAPAKEEPAIAGSGLKEADSPSEESMVLSSPPYVESSDDEDYTRPKRVKVLTKDEVIIQGLTSGKDAQLEVKREGIAGRGVFALESIQKGSWLCEYRTGAVYQRSDKKAMEAEYAKNGEGNYIVESAYSVPDVGHLCFDATRKYDQIGRYINHARNPNAFITRPIHVRGKWRVGFVAIKNIDVGDEVVWNYGVCGEPWSGCRLVDGVIRPTKEMIEAMEKEAEKKDDDDLGEGKVVRRGHRKCCYCPIVGCTTKPLSRLSNHLSQVHGLTSTERKKYLGQNRKIATQKEVTGQVKKTVLRRSQRTLKAVIHNLQRLESEDSSEPEVIDLSVNDGGILSSEQSGSQSLTSESVISDNPAPLHSDSMSSEKATPLLSDSMNSDKATPVLSASRRRRQLVFPDDTDEEYSYPKNSPTEASLSDSCNPAVGASSTSCPTSSDCAVLATSGSTRDARRHSLDEPFLVTFADFLSSRTGGRKQPNQVLEICTDVSKYLWYADPSKCDSTHLLSRRLIRSFVEDLEAGGIGSSGILTKLRRLCMALKHLQMEQEDMEGEIRVGAQTSVVLDMVEALCGSLKKDKSRSQQRNLDKFAKTLPDLGEVNRFLSMPEIDATYSETVAKAKEGTVTNESLHTAMVIVAGKLMLRNGQRPGAIAGMRMKEVEEADDSADYLIVLVEEHKGSKMAKIAASGTLKQQLHDWLTTLRPLYVKCSECPYVFGTKDGSKLSQLSRSLSDVAKKFNVTLTNATGVRKAIATKGGTLESGKKAALAHAMSHSLPTAEQYYRAYDDSKNIEGYDVVGSLLELPSEKKRQRFTEEQNEVVAQYFAAQIECKVMPSSKLLDEFLATRADLFLGRKRSDIYSKVRNFIGRK